ncbi:MAG: TadE/TadG family type IV pilus assembly protein [Terriglobales bacterium]|jgi:Flp pilus assembly protein TadG
MTSNHRRIRSESGQAVIEFATVVLLMTILIFGLVDYSRAIYDSEVITNLTREGSNLASRGTDMPAAATDIISQSDLPNMTTQGEVIITSVQNIGGTYTITNQAIAGSYPGPSKVGSKIGGAATLPPAAKSIPLAGQTIYVTEVYYGYTAITPIGSLMKLMGGPTNLPAALYDIAYF